MRLEDVVDIDDRGVSPVIGVILMIAITVILAAVIASFVLGLGPGNTAPTASFSGEFDSGGTQMTITLESSNSDVQADNIRISYGSTNVMWYEADGNSGIAESSVISAGQSVTVGDGTPSSEGDVNSGDSIDIVYVGGDGSSVIQTLEA